jgi:N-acetylglucosaminyldiphosphoundecaprenol N-acetyl-beta-D-mannosaminyltransferase
MIANAIKILGVKIDNLEKSEIEDSIEIIIDGPPAQKFVVTLNPEIILEGHRDKNYKIILNSADLSLCDGFGIKFVSWLKMEKIKSRFTGVELVDFCLKQCKNIGCKVLVVVSKKSLSTPDEIEWGIAEKCGVNVRARYWEGEGFFESEEALQAEIVFVNFGAPGQEKFIFENRKKFPKAKILAGVGGAFDFLTGKIKRAPKWMQKAGLEWLWRLAQEPRRIKRIIDAVFVFPAAAAINLRKK